MKPLFVDPVYVLHVRLLFFYIRSKSWKFSNFTSWSVCVWVYSVWPLQVCVILFQNDLYNYNLWKDKQYILLFYFLQVFGYYTRIQNVSKGVLRDNLFVVGGSKSYFRYLYYVIFIIFIFSSGVWSFLAPSLPLNLRIDTGIGDYDRYTLLPDLEFVFYMYQDYGYNRIYA